MMKVFSHRRFWQHSAIALSLSLILTTVGCNKPDTVQTAPTDLSEKSAQQPVVVPIQSLGDAELQQIGTKNELPTQWILPGAYYAQYTAPARFMKFKFADQVAQFLMKNPNMLVFANEFPEFESLLTSNRIALVPLLDPQTNNVVRPQSPFPVNAVYIRKLKPIDREKMLADVFTGVPKDKIQKIQIDGKEVLLFEQAIQLPMDQEQKQFAKIDGITSALYYPDEKSAVFLIGPRPTIDEFFTFGDGEKRGAAAQIIGRLDVNHIDFAFTSYYDQPFVAMTPVFFPDPLGSEIAKGAKYTLLTIDSGEDIAKNGLHLYVNGKTPESTSAIQVALGGTLMQLGQQATQAGKLPGGLPLPAFMKNIDGIIKQIKTETKDSLLIANLPGSSDVVTFFGDVFKDLNEQMKKAIQMQQSNITADQIFNIGRLMTAYYGKNGTYPPMSINSADGKPLLSWRVALLPSFGPEGEALYKQFKLDQPWNGPDNIKLLDKIPPIYRSAVSPELKSKTTFRIFNSPNTPFGKNPKGIKIQDIPNPNKTFMVVSTAPSHAVEWTQPDVLEFNKEKSTTVFGELVVAIPVMGDVIRAAVDGKPEGIEKLNNWILGNLPAKAEGDAIFDAEKPNAAQPNAPKAAEPKKDEPKKDEPKKDEPKKPVET